jgi:N-acetylglucosamine-6-sulfatase
VPSPKTRRWFSACGLLVIVAVIATDVGFLAFARDHDHKAGTERRPNVLVITTDDQRLDEMRVMPITTEKIGGAGVTFSEAVVTYPVCCPSRVTLFTGQLTHNHKVFGNGAPNGGYPAYEPLQENSLPVWLRDAGYATALVGKFLNGYGAGDSSEVPPGWDHWRALIQKAIYEMWGYWLNEDGKVRRVGTPGLEDPKLYQTDVLAEIASGLIEEMATGDKPFYLQFNPTRALAYETERPQHRLSY